MNWGISIIIPVYNDLEGLKRTVDCLAVPDEFEHEIIICNDGANDAITNWIPDTPYFNLINLKERKENL